MVWWPGRHAGIPAAPRLLSESLREEMANEKGTSDEKKARLEAIRAANAAKKSQEAGNGDTMPVAAVTATPAAPPTVAATTAPAAVGANMSDDKKAKLEAIR